LLLWGNRETNYCDDDKYDPQLFHVDLNEKNGAACAHPRRMVLMQMQMSKIQGKGNNQ